MRRRVTLWVFLGILVACAWVAIALFAGLSYNAGRSTLAAITAPAALLGRKMPLGAPWFILLNGGLYGIIGLLIESVRWPLRSR